MTIAIATYGDDSWATLANERAIPSADYQGAQVIHHHAPDGDLAQARNAVLDQVDTEWVVHLDADDELEPGYLAALAASDADLRAPAVRYIKNGHAYPPRIPRVAGHHHLCTADCLPQGNWLVVGSAVRAELARDVGGWRDFQWSEDWDLWLRCWLAGASIEAVPEAIYRAHVRLDSRNRAATHELRQQQHEAIYAANFGQAALAQADEPELTGPADLDDDGEIDDEEDGDDYAEELRLPRTGRRRLSWLPRRARWAA